MLESESDFQMMRQEGCAPYVQQRKSVQMHNKTKPEAFKFYSPSTRLVNIVPNEIGTVKRRTVYISVLRISRVAFLF